MFAVSEEPSVKCLESLLDILGNGRTASLVFRNLWQSLRIFGSLQKSSEINCRKNDGRKLLDILNKIILAFLEPFCFFLEKMYFFIEFFTVSVKMPKTDLTVSCYKGRKWNTCLVLSRYPRSDPAWISYDYFVSLLLPQWEEKTTRSNRMKFRIIQTLL